MLERRLEVKPTKSTKVKVDARTVRRDARRTRGPPAGRGAGAAAAAGSRAHSHTLQPWHTKVFPPRRCIVYRHRMSALGTGHDHDPSARPQMFHVVFHVSNCQRRRCCAHIQDTRGITTPPPRHRNPDSLWPQPILCAHGKHASSTPVSKCRGGHQQHIPQ